MTTMDRNLFAGAALVLCLAARPAGALPPEAVRGIDAYLAAYARSIPAPGFSAVVVADGEIAFAKGYGRETAGSAKPMTARSSTAIGSLTKSFTALAVLQLAEQGKVSLDDPVLKHLPWFQTMDAADSAAITIRMLLSNSSGLASDPPGAWVSTLEEDPDALQRAVRELAGISLQRRGGTAFEYSNSGFNVAGAIVERVSGLTYAEYLDRHVLQPLGMSRSTSSLARFAGLGVLYGHTPGIGGPVPAEPSFIPGMLGAGSELRCSAEDLGRYLAALLGGGARAGRRVLSPGSVELLWTPVSSFQYPSSRLAPDERTWSYGLGWFISRVEGRVLVHHGGNRLTMSSYAVIEPARKLAAAILMNVDSLDPYRYVQPPTVVNNLLHFAAGEPTTEFMVEKGPDPAVNAFELPAGDIERFTGEYVSQAGDGRLEVVRDGRRLVARLAVAGRRCEGVLDFATPATAYVRNFSGSLALTFRETPEGRVTGCEMPMIGGFLKQPADAYAAFRRVLVPGPARGTRVSVLVPAGWTLAERDGVLEASAPEGGARISVRLAAAGAAVAAGRPSAPTSSAVERFEMLAGRAWRERASRAPGPEDRIALTADTTIAGMRLTATLEAPADAVTGAARDALVPLLSGTREQ